MDCHIQQDAVIVILKIFVAAVILFAKNTKGYTLTLSNLGPVAVEEPFQEKIEDFHVMIGVSPRQPLKCGVMAFGDTVDLTIASVKADRRFADYVYGWLEQEGILTGREENGAFASEFDRGSYPEMTEEKNRISHRARALQKLREELQNREENR